MDRKELIKKYIEFFKSKGHAEIRNSSLIPENDPTVLFVVAGMQPIVPYLTGQTHPSGKRLVNVQKCIRTVDIEEVGDSYHHTLFEMMGNWSLGNYFKEEAIEMSFEFLTKALGIPLERLAVTVFAGNEHAPKDEESLTKWKSLGVDEKRIALLSDNWWGPAGKTGPCGPDTEMFYWKLNDVPAPETFDPEDDNWVEIWNDVLMQYEKDSEGNYIEAKQHNVDTGMGTERTVAALTGLEDNYLADMWKPLIEKIEELSGKSYEGNERIMRIIADHIKAAVFLIADGVLPGNSEQGYILRRLIRRAVRFAKKLEIPTEKDLTTPLVEELVKIYEDYNFDKKKIEEILNKEEEQFEKTLEKGLREFEKMATDSKIGAKEAFLLYQSYGFPIEMIKELSKEKDVLVDEEGFNEELKKHQELSRTASAGKFKSGLADDSEATTKLHTATHMLNEALRVVLKDDSIQQRGSNITPDRLRFDFNFDRKVTREELDEIENLINQKIEENIPITCEEMSVPAAKESGAIGIFDDKYEGDVTVYTIGEFSKEICTGPHVANTSELGKFKIKKEESSSAGVRRIKATLN